MKKGYMISAHRSKADPQKRSAYIQLALPAIEKGGGKILASTNDTVSYTHLTLPTRLPV